MPTSWSKDTIWWHVYPLGFVDAPRTLADAPNEPVHRLRQLINWLDYVVSLGANGLLLGPIFRSVKHGYDTLDHDAIDPRLGDTDDFTKLVGECRARGIRVVLDGVFNHISVDHPIAERAIAGGPDSEDGQWIRWSGTYPYLFEGQPGLVALNLSHPMVQEYVITHLIHWLDLGADGWRLDAAYAAGPDAWRPIIDGVRSHRPDAWFLGEVIHGDYPDFVARSGVDSLTQYELWKAIWSSLNEKNLWELDHALGRHSTFCQSFLPNTFIGNHDVTRIATKITDERHRSHAIALLAMLPGIPSVYEGDEQGFTGEKTESEFGDDAVRPAFPDTPAGLLPYGAPTLELYQRLIGLRRRHPWLTTAALSTRELENEHVVIRLSSGFEKLELALNLSDTARGRPSGQLLTSSDPGADDLPAHGWTVTQP